MELFVAVAAALTLGGLALMVRPLFGRLRPAETRAQKDARLYREQLAEVERDLERGVIRPDEAEGARAEISRRLLAAAARAGRTEAAGRAPAGLTGLVAGLAIIGLPLLAAIVYLGGGAPGMPDRPLAGRAAALATDRPGQEEAEAAAPAPPAPAPTADAEQFAELIEKLEAVVAERPDDAQGLTLLANGYMRLGRNGDAWRTYDRLIALRRPDVPAELHALKAEAMVLAAGGYVSPEAEQAIAATLEREPANQVGRYYRGLALAQQGRLAEAVALWQALRDEAPEGAPWLEPLDGMLAEARAELGQGAGQGAAGGAGLPGPDRATLDAAAEMTPEERREMIAGMVARLEARLASEGGEVEEWVRLMASYMQLGKPDEARRAYRLGREALGDDGGASALRQQALVLGVIEE